MIRAPRRIGQDDRSVITPAIALRWELSDSWPSLSERLRFWTAPEVPKHLTEWQRPDPRKVLDGEPQRIEYEADEAHWREQRLAWLRERARG